MAIRYKIYQSQYPYHIYNRVNNKEHLFNLGLAFPVFLFHLKRVSLRTDFRPHHFILMNNHFHLIGSTPKANLFDFMRDFQTIVSQSLNKILNRTDHIFGHCYGATVIKSENYMANIIKYLYQNSVQAGISNNPLNYAYSTLKFYLDNTWKNYGLSLDPYLESLPKENRENILKELTEVFLDKAQYERVRKDLKRKSIDN